MTDPGRQPWPLEGDRAALARAVRAALQLQRDVATGRIKKAASSIVARGGVTLDSASAELIEIGAEDPMGREAVQVRFGDQRAAEVTCRCPTMKRMGGCHHALAGLETLFVELSRPAPEPTPAPHAEGTDYLSRIEAIGARLARDRRARAGAADPWRALALRSEEVRYVVRFAGQLERAAFTLEAEARPRPVAGGGEATSRWRPIPFGLARAADGPCLDDFGPDHAAVAAIARGSVDAERAATAGRRDLALARLDRAVAPALLAAAEDAVGGPVLFRAPGRARAGAELPALCLALDAPSRLELAAAERGGPELAVLGAIRLPGGEREPLPSVLAVGPTGLVALRTASHEVTLAVLDTPGARHVIEELQRAPLHVPEDDASALASLRSVATVVDSLERRAAPPPGPVPFLRIESPTEAPRGGLVMDCTLRFDYGGTLVDYGSVDEVVPTLDGRSVARDRDLEDTAVQRFFELGGERRSSSLEHDGTIRADRFEGMVGALVDEGWRVVAEDRLVRGAGNVTISVASGVDWFELSGGVTFGDEEVPLPTLLEAASANRGFVTLADGSRGLLPEAWLERWRLAALGEAGEDGQVRFDRTQGWILAELSRQVSAEVDDPFRALRGDLESLGRPGPADPPPGFQGSLRPYQREGLGWLQHLDRTGLSGLLADDMGLGKTVQVLAWLEGRRAADPGARFLVVAPKSLVFNWLAEARRFAPQLVAVDFSGAGRWRRFEEAGGGALFVTTYGSLRRDAEALHDHVFDAVVLDEAQAIKSARSQTSMAARALRARRRVSLTGTPIENHLGDLWSQLDFLNPGMLGRASAFQRIGATRDRAALIDDGHDLLRRALRPIMLRRTKEAVLSDLPPKTEQTLLAPMAETQAAKYGELRTYFQAQLSMSRHDRKMARLEDPSAPEMNVLAALTRLRQCACHPGLVDRTLAAERSGKLDLVLPMLEDIVASGQKALVFSSFTELLALVRTRLELARVPYLTLDGQTTKRGERVQDFQTAEGGRVFLISIKAGGAGLNLTAADYVFLIDPWWNPAAEAQAIDRAHRIGRERPVHVYRVLTEGTVEARVAELQERKRELAGRVLTEANDAPQAITASDLAFLLG